MRCYRSLVGLWPVCRALPVCLLLIVCLALLAGGVPPGAWLCAARAAEGGSDETNRTPDCVYVGTPYDIVDKMLEMAQVSKRDLVIDPGCGDGRIAIGAARRYGCRAIGYEIDPPLAAAARRIAQKRKVGGRVSIKEQDIFTVDYRKATVIAMYLLPDMIVRLIPEFDKLQPGSRIVAHDYGIDGVKADAEEEVFSNEDNSSHRVFLYTVPLKKEQQ